MRPAVTRTSRPATAVTHVAPWVEPPRLRVIDGLEPHVGITYDSENYALLNRPIETGRHARRIERYLRPNVGDRLLEVGCGRGWLTQRMQEEVPSTYGIDVNPMSIAHAVTEQLLVMDATALRFEDEQFDHVYSFHAIEHIADAARALHEMHRVLAPGGRALLVYPAEPIRGLYAMPGAWIGFGNPFLARQLHVHAFTPKRIRRIAEPCGFRHLESALDFFITPQFMTVLEKSPRRR